MIMTKCPACDGTGFDDDACGCLKCDRTGKVPTQTQVTGPVDDDNVQIDNAVEDLLTTIIERKVLEWMGDYVPGECMTEIVAQYRKDLASAGIRLIYDATIGGK